MSCTDRLSAALREEGGLLADALRAERPPDEALLAAVQPGSHALAFAAVREAYLLHYDEGRVLDTADADLALLGGDRLYALALAELATLGDLDAIAALAELIAVCARARAEGDASAAAVAWETAADAFARRA